MSPVEHDWHTVASRIRNRLAEISDRHPQEREAALQTILLLDQLESLYRSAVGPTGLNVDGRQRPSRRRTYCRRIKNGQEYLVEDRGADSQPFFVPKPVYTAITKSMCDTDGPVSSRDLIEDVERAMDTRLADYLLRTVLRFWRQEGIIEKVKTRYTPMKLKGFRRIAGEAFDALDTVEES